MRFVTLFLSLAVVACVCSNVVSFTSESRTRTTRDLYRSGFDRYPLRTHDDYPLDPSISKFLNNYLRFMVPKYKIWIVKLEPDSGSESKSHSKQG